MNTKLKTLTTLAAICGTFAVAAPAQAKNDTNPGAAQRCAAAVNGNHYGFTCEDAVDDAANGKCPRGYDATMLTILPEVDLNANNRICVRPN